MGAEHVGIRHRLVLEIERAVKTKTPGLDAGVAAVVLVMAAAIVFFMNS